MASDADWLKALQEVLGPGGLLIEASDMAPYLSDWRGNYTGNALAVARPASTAATARVVALASAQGVPIVPQGGNTGLVGGGVPDASGRALVISTQRLQRIRSLDRDNNSLTAEAGVVLTRAQEAAGQASRLFPISLAAEGSCTLGGIISTNAGGTQVLRYGNTRDQVLGLEVVLASGEVWNGLRGLRKDNTGYDLKQLFIGAEGTLGIITAATVKLHPRPRASATALVAVPGIDAAVALLASLRERFGDHLEGVELIGRTCLDLVFKHIPDTREPFADQHAWQVLIELTDMHANAPLAEELADCLGGLSLSGLVTDAVIATSTAQAQALWRLREEISEAQRKEGKSIKHDISLPISKLAEFTARADAALTSLIPGIRLVNFGHIGDGNLHYNCGLPEADANAQMLLRAQDINRVVYDLVAALGGSISAEHGLGVLKREEITRHKSALEIDLMRAVKAALDPAGIMNPGKVLSLL